MENNSGRDSAYETPLDRGDFIGDNGYDQAAEIMSPGMPLQ